MIGDWIKYITDMLASAVRGSVLVQLISTLLSTSKTAQDSLNAYIADARLRSAATWQTCWLEKLLSDNLGYMVTITEASGLPVDFVVTGVSYTDAARASALLNRYKLAGRSYILEFGDVDVTAQWSDYICEKTANIVTSARFGDYVCEKQQIVLRVINAFGLSVENVEFNAAGNYSFNESPYSIVHNGLLSVIQTGATEGGTPVPTSSSCEIYVREETAPYTNEIEIIVDENTTGLEKSWTFQISDSYEQIELVIYQTSI